MTFLSTTLTPPRKMTPAVYQTLSRKNRDRWLKSKLESNVAKRLETKFLDGLEDLMTAGVCPLLMNTDCLARVLMFDESELGRPAWGGGSLFGLPYVVNNPKPVEPSLSSFGEGTLSHLNRAQRRALIYRRKGE